MSDFISHVAAIGIGVAITLYLVGGFNNNNNGDATSDAKKGGKGSSNSNSNGSANNAGPKKRNRKKTKKKAAPAKAAAAAAVVAEKQTAKVQAPVVEPAPVAKEPEAAVLVPKATPTATASATATATPTATPTPTPATGGKKNKKKKNKKQPAAAVAAANPAPVAVAAPTATATATPTPAATPTAPVVVPLQPRTEREEEAWATIPSKSKKKKTAAQKKQQAALAAASLAASGAAAAAAASLTVTIDASRVGIVIGPRGATMNSIQEKTGTKLDVNAPAKPEDGGGASAGASAASNGQFRPVVNGSSSSSNKAKATVVVSEGTPEMQQVAKRAVLELADRGYATLLQAEGFGESSVSVHPRFLSEIVGSQGKTIKAIQTALDVKLTIPKTEWSPKQPQIGNSEPSCRIGIAGDLPANVKTAKQVIRDLCQYHHHEITHPGFVHQEVNVPTEFFHCVIGTRGSEIKHIRGNYKVEVYMPSNESWCTTDNVLCVGKSNDVEKAINYIKLLMERDTELREQKYSDEHFGDDAEGW